MERQEEEGPSAAGVVTESEVPAQVEPVVPDAAAERAARTAAAVARLEVCLRAIRSRRHGGVR